MVNAEIYKANQTTICLYRVVECRQTQMKCRGLTRLKKMWFILLGQTTQKAMPQGGQPLKQHYDGTLHSLWHFDWHCSLGWRCCDVEVYAFIGEITWAQTLSKKLAIRSYS
jgi:hypothetical protein